MQEVFGPRHSIADAPLRGAKQGDTAMQRGQVFTYFLTIAVVFSSACAGEVLDEAQVAGDDVPEVALTTEEVVHNDSLTFLRQDGIGGTNRTTYGVTGTLVVGIAGSSSGNMQYSRWEIANGNFPSRVKYAYAIHCEPDSQSVNGYLDRLLMASEKSTAAVNCNRISFAELSFIVDNAVTQP
jgi:hypothetical protein